MAAYTSDLDRLFGVLALRLDFLDEDQLAKSLAQSRATGIPLGQILVERKDLSEAHRQLLDEMVRCHVERHGNDPRRSVRSLQSNRVFQFLIDESSDESADGTASYGPAEDAIHATPSAGEPTPDSLASTDISGANFERVSRGGRAGRFRVLRPHAKGGLGIVYVAQDEEIGREVALKEIQRERAHETGSRNRFLLEAEVTGKLEHPGIVPVYGLGRYPDGRPFYAMRFIRGESLQRAIQRFHAADAAGRRDPTERSLALRQLLRRFHDVCNAIDYAHASGVLHRDLKPANIMLGKFGETLVVDWGLAKTLGRDDLPTSAETVAVAPMTPGGEGTELGRIIGTPAYMSPEQAEGRIDLLGPTSDVYSLGATLYSLITGVAPFHHVRSELMLERVRRGEFDRPRLVNPLVPPALEAICLKAMRQRQEDRYATAAELRADVDNFLEDAPVGAWREPLRVRLRRTFKRHRTLAMASITGLAVAFLGMIAATLLLTRVNEKLESTNGQLQSAIANERDANQLAQKEADRARISELLAQKQTVVANREKAFAEEQKSLAENRKILAEENEAKAKREADRANEVAKFLVGLYDANDPTGFTGFAFGPDPQQSANLTALQVLDRGARKIETSLKDQPEIRAALMTTIGSVYRTLGRYGEAEKFLHAALELRKQRPEEVVDLALAHFHVGWLHHIRGDEYDALREFDQAIALAESPAGKSRPDSEKIVLDSELLKGWIYAQRFESAKAEKIFRKLVTVQIKRHGPEHYDVAIAQAGLAATLFQQEKFLPALPHVTSAMSYYRKYHGDSSVVAAMGHVQSGLLNLGLGKHSAASDDLRTGADIVEKGLGANHPFRAWAIGFRGEVARVQGRTEDAIKLYEQCLDVCEKGIGFDHPLVLRAVLIYGELLKRVDRLDGLWVVYEKALASQKLRSENRPIIAQTLRIYGHQLASYGQIEKGRDVLRLALEVDRRLPPGSNPDSGKIRQELAALESRTDGDAALEIWKEAAELWPADSPEFADERLETLLNRIDFSLERRRPEDARLLLKDLSAFAVAHPKVRLNGNDVNFNDLILDRERRLRDVELNERVFAARFAFLGPQTPTLLTAAVGHRLGNAPLPYIAVRSMTWRTIAQTDGTLNAEDAPAKNNPQSRERRFTFDLTAGRVYRFHMKSNEIDSFLRLDNPAGKQVAANDDSNGTLDSLIQHACSTTGTYVLWASNYDPGKLGKFQITAQIGEPSTPVARRRGPAFEMVGKLSEGDAEDPKEKRCFADVYRLNLQPGQRYRIVVESKDFRPVSRIENTTLSKVFVYDNFGISFRSELSFLSTASSEVRLIVSSEGFGAVGRYRLRIESAGETAPTSDAPIRCVPVP